MAIYYALVCFLLILAGPFLLAAKKRRAGILQKLGVVPASLIRNGKDRPVWFHAVSVGEFNAVWPLVLAFRERHPHKAIVISTATQTGQTLARQKASNFATVVYFPLDLPWALNNWLDCLNPSLAAIVETEIWPGFTHECSKRGIPLVVVNGRISPRSFTAYYRWRWLFGRVIRQFKMVVAQSQADADRYRAIAGESLPVMVSGNLKFDRLEPIATTESLELKRQLGLSANTQVIVAGSTHGGEEEALLDAWQSIRSSAAGGGPVRLVLAPRHPERFDEVAALIARRGFKARRFSLNESFEQEDDVYLLDTIGQLFRYYSVASIAFVGGTLVPIGGHSLVEPCAYGIPVVCGPHTEKTRDSASGLTGAGALIVAQDAKQLSDRLRELVLSEELRSQSGAAGRLWLDGNQGAIETTMRVLDTVLAEYNETRPCQPKDNEVLTTR